VEHGDGDVGSAMYVVGGADSDCGTLEDAFVYDSAEGSWSEGVPMPERRYDASACTIGRYIYIFSGNVGPFSVDSVLKFDTEASKWSQLADIPYHCSDCVGWNGLYRGR
jgi:hypothetical protein